MGREKEHSESGARERMSGARGESGVREIVMSEWARNGVSEWGERERESTMKEWGERERRVSEWGESGE